MHNTKRSEATRATRGCSLRSSKRQPSGRAIIVLLVVGSLLISTNHQLVSFNVEAAATSSAAAAAASSYGPTGQSQAAGHMTPPQANIYRTSAASSAAAGAGGMGGLSQSTGAASLMSGSPIRSRFRPPHPARSFNRGPFAVATAAAATTTPVRSNRQQAAKNNNSNNNNNKIQRQLDSLLRQLIELEEAETQSLADCSKWDHLNARYLELIGRHQQQQFASRQRPTELRKRQECDELFRMVSDFRNKLQTFRELAARENGHLELVSNLVNQYVDLRDSLAAAAGGSSQLASEFEQLKQADLQTQIGVENLDQFIGFMRQKLDLVPAAAAESVVARSADDIDLNSNGEIDGDNEIEELDSALRKLINREDLLAEEEHEQLSELGDLLESVLAEGHVDQKSAKFRYLFGTLEAARLVSLRKLRGQHTDEFQLGQPEPVTTFEDDEQQQQQQQRDEAEDEAEAEAMAYAASLTSSGHNNNNVIFESAHAAASPRMSSPPPPPPSAANLKQFIEPVVSQQVAQAMAAAKTSSGNNNNNNSASLATAHAQSSNQNRANGNGQVAASSAAASSSGNGNSAATAGSTVSSSSPPTPWHGMGERLRRRFASFQN